MEPFEHGSDKVQLYSVEPWKTHGFGVPAYGENDSTANYTIFQLVDIVGKNQLALMSGFDARRDQPPSINTMQGIFKMLERAYAIFTSRMIPENQKRVELGHATPMTNVFTIHPCPYFSPTYMRNHWLREYNEWIMVFLANAMQHSDNQIPNTLTEAFVGNVWQYLKQIKLRAGVELCGFSKDDMLNDEFWPDDAAWAEFAPLQKVTHVEALGYPGDVNAVFTEDQLRPLYDGIPAHQVLSEPYPLARPGGTGQAAGTSTGGGQLPVP